jgi:hypothetical protein
MSAGYQPHYGKSEKSEKAKKATKSCQERFELACNQHSKKLK